MHAIAAFIVGFTAISAASEHVLENRFLKRVWTTDGGTLRTSALAPRPSSTSLQSHGTT
jgi:hypothetical protein